MISGILPLFLNVITANKSAAYYSSAYKIADSLIEDCRSKSFDSVVDDSIVIPDLPEGQANIVTSNEIDGFTENDIKKVSLTLSWDFKNYQEIKIVTYIARDGL